jgi:hypothetical protein
VRTRKEGCGRVERGVRNGVPKRAGRYVDSVRGISSARDFKQNKVPSTPYYYKYLCGYL